MTSPLMKPTLVGRDTLHELDQPLKKLAYVSNHWGPLLPTNIHLSDFDGFNEVEMLNLTSLVTGD